MRIICISLLLLPVFLSPVRLAAAEGQGEMFAVILDPILMDVESAKRFCKEERYLVKCHLFREKLREERQASSLDEPFEKVEKKQQEYNVLTTTFE